MILNRWRVGRRRYLTQYTLAWNRHHARAERLRLLSLLQYATNVVCGGSLPASGCADLIKNARRHAIWFIQAKCHDYQLQLHDQYPAFSLSFC